MRDLTPSIRLARLVASKITRTRMSGRHFRLATLIKMTKLTKTQTKRFKKWIGSWTFLGTKVEGTGLAIGFEQHLADELTRQREDFSKAIDKAVEEERERNFKNMNSYNVAFCNKCKGIYKTEGHKDCSKSPKP